MNADAGSSDYTLRELPFDEWADLDTLLHRAALSCGDFDYALRPLCPDCGDDLAMEYEEIEGDGSLLAALLCESCHLTWRLAAADAEALGPPGGRGG